MIGDRILEFADLQQLSGQQQRAAVERWARANGIRFGYNRGGIWTTLDAVNAALGVAPEGLPAILDPDLVGPLAPPTAPPRNRGVRLDRESELGMARQILRPRGRSGDA